MRSQSDIRRNVTEQIIESLKNGGLPPWRKTWSDDPNAPGQHTSLSTDRPYRGINQLILQCAAMRGAFKSKWWGTFHQVRQNNAHVRKAQKGAHVVLWKDCDGMYTSAVHLGLLRSALYGQANRIVTNHSSQLPDDLPPSFETTSRFIFCANQAPKKNPMFDAVLTRCLVYRLDLTNSEIIEQFRVMTANGYPGVPEQVCSEIVDFIEQHGGEKQLSMRLLTPPIRIYKFCTDQGSDWQPILFAQLQNLGRPPGSTKRLNGHTQDAGFLRQSQSQFPESVADQQKWWRQATGKSRASFYRCLQRYRSETE